MRDIVKPGLVLFVITLVSVLVLSVANELTKDLIAQNELGEVAESLEEVLPAEKYGERVYTGEDMGVTSYIEAISGGETVGWAVFVSVNGYGGEIKLLTAMDDEGVIKGIDVLTHSETRNLGSKADEEPFKGQFAGLSGGITLNVEVEAITSATITSKAVVDGVNQASAYFDQNLAEGGAQ